MGPIRGKDRVEEGYSDISHRKNSTCKVLAAREKREEMVSKIQWS